MRAPLLACLCLVISGCPTDSSTPQSPEPGDEAVGAVAQPWPRLKAIIIADLTAPENRPVDLEAEEDKAVRGALAAPGRAATPLPSSPRAVPLKSRYSRATVTDPVSEGIVAFRPRRSDPCPSKSRAGRR